MQKIKVSVAVMAALVANSVLVQSQANAEDYDMDCKVILCLVGGFPFGCSDAKSYMYKRLRRAKPPFGICTLSDGGSYDSVDLSMTRTTGVSSYYCEPPNQLYMRTYWADRRDGPNELTVGQNYCKTPSGSTYGTAQTDWRFQVTVEPGTEVEYTSAVYNVDIDRGKVYEGDAIRHVTTSGRPSNYNSNNQSQSHDTR